MVAAHADHPQVLISASMLARRLGATAEALAWSSRAEELAPSFASALTLGFAHLHLDQLDEAIGAWRKAMARDPSNLELPVQLAWELAACDRLEDALVFVDRVLAVDPSHNARSEEHTSELQSRPHLVCRLLLEKKKKQKKRNHINQKKKTKNN